MADDELFDSDDDEQLQGTDLNRLRYKTLGSPLDVGTVQQLTCEPLSLAAGAAVPASSLRQRPSSARLSPFVAPSHYALKLEPKFAEGVIDGHVLIDIDVDTTDDLYIDAIQLNVGSGLTVHEAGIRPLDNRTNPDNKRCALVKAITKPYDGVVLLAFDALPKLLAANETSLQLELYFEATLDESLAGFYKSTLASGEEIAVTQFEATDARRAFPCFDEPAMKATFDVSIIADRKYKTVLSNGDVASRTDIAGGDRAITVFHRTPRMSTYLVAFLVSNFEFIEAPLKRSDGTSTRVRVYSTPESLASGELNHSLASALGALHVYESLFEIAFPLPKIDLVAIPDFAAGAMENWGLITFRQTALLASPEHSTASDYRYVSAVVAHELAHQWFGNLVTMEWWSDLWLNEGFATFCEYLAVDTLEPSYRMFDLFRIDEISRALEADSLVNSHPIKQPAETHADIEELFDAISYSKGGSILFMLWTTLGRDVFLQGVVAYLRAHAYGNAQSADLFASIGRAAGQDDLPERIEGWILQRGYPLVRTGQLANGSITFEQHRFVLDANADDGSGAQEADEDDPLWWVPLLVAHVAPSPPSQPVTPAHVDLNGRTTMLHSAAATTALAVLPNAGRAGFYRSALLPAHFESLVADSFDLSRLPPRDVATLIDDVAALAAAQDAKHRFIDVVRLVERFMASRQTTPTALAADAEVYYIASDALSSAQALLEADSDATWSTAALVDVHARLLAPLISYASSTLFAPVTTAPAVDSSLVHSLASLALARGVHMNVTAAVSAVNTCLENVACSSSVPPDAQSATYYALAQRSTADIASRLASLQATSTGASEQRRLLVAHASSKRPEEARARMQDVLDDKVRRQDVATVVSAVAHSSVANRRLAFAFFEQHFDDFVAHTRGMFILPRVLSAVSAGAVGDDDQSAVLRLFTAKADVFEKEGGVRTTKQLRERLELNRVWIKHNAQSLEDGLKKQ